MKRDFERCRKILLEVEKCHDLPLDVYPISIDGYTNEQVGFHVYLLGQAGLLEVADWSSMNSHLTYHPLSITWDGYEFLDAARDENVWKKALGEFSSKGVPVTFDLLKVVLAEVVKTLLFQSS